MATVFWDSPGIVFVDYLENEKIVTSQYYASLLQQLFILSSIWRRSLVVFYEFSLPEMVIR